MATFTMPSGAILEVTPASAVDAAAFRNAYIKAGGDELVATLQGKKLDADANMRMTLRLISDPDVESSVYRCGVKALYEKIRVTSALLDDPQVGEKARKDWGTIVARMAEVNVLPFFA